jgi:hypothetical protein
MAVHAPRSRRVYCGGFFVFEGHFDRAVKPHVFLEKSLDISLKSSDEKQPTPFSSEFLP